MNPQNTTNPKQTRRHLTALALAAVLGLALVAGTTPTAHAQGHGMVRGGIGFDPIGGGIGFNAGGGYRAPMTGSTWYEGVADIYYHNGSEDWTEEGYTGTTKTELTLVVARFNMLFNYDDPLRRMFPIVGFGFFAGGGEWSETEQSLAYSDIRYNDGGEGKGFGNVFNFGLGFKAGERADIRVEAPVMVFWGNAANAVSIPLTVSAGVHF